MFLPKVFAVRTFMAGSDIGKMSALLDFDMSILLIPLLATFRPANPTTADQSMSTRRGGWRLRALAHRVGAHCIDWRTLLLFHDDTGRQDHCINFWMDHSIMLPCNWLIKGKFPGRWADFCKSDSSWWGALMTGLAHFTCSTGGAVYCSIDAQVLIDNSIIADSVPGMAIRCEYNGVPTINRSAHVAGWGRDPRDVRSDGILNRL